MIEKKKLSMAEIRAKLQEIEDQLPSTVKDEQDKLLIAASPEPSRNPPITALQQLLVQFAEEVLSSWNTVSNQHNSRQANIFTYLNSGKAKNLITEITKCKQRQT